jgi:hypothetical protein
MIAYKSASIGALRDGPSNSAKGVMCDRKIRCLGREHGDFSLLAYK